MKRRLFVDMDGTIARFHDEVNYLEQMFEENFFFRLQPFNEAVEGLRLFMKQNPQVEVYIISSCIDGEPPYCMNEKEKWLDQYLPEVDAKHRLFPKIGENKASYIPGGISETDVLYDDYNKNLEEWREAGGKAVKCKNNINHLGLKGKLWDGAIIENDIFPVAFAEQLDSLINHELVYHKNSKHVLINGQVGTWRTIDSLQYNGEIYYLMEHEGGCGTAYNVIVNADGSFRLGECWNGFEDLIKIINSEIDNEMEI